MKYRRALTIRILVCITVIALVWVLVSPDPIGGESPAVSNHRDTIKCAIGLNHGIFSAKGKNVGFHYELLTTFSKASGMHSSIIPPVEEPHCWEMLVKDSIQILVVDGNDSIPEQYASEILLSVPVKNNEVWAVSAQNCNLLNSINFWYADIQGEGFFKSLSHNYFRSYKLDWLVDHAGAVTSISPYDDIIRKYSSQIGLDWRLLSAIVYQESQYRIGATSGKSAKGLMQIKKSTAARYGIDDIYDPESNVHAGTRHLDYLLNLYRKEGLDSANVVKFALAAYNVGEGALAKKRSTADSLGFNPNDWDEVARSFEVAGTSNQTALYIEEVLNTYETYRSLLE